MFITKSSGATLELRVGDLFDSTAHAIGHGVNTHGKMGAGIAVVFRKRYPQMYEHYKTLCENFGDWLGGKSYVYFDGELSDGYVANIFSQKKPGANAELELLIDGIRDVFLKLSAEQELSKPHLAVPLIGCGIGGLDWDSDVKPALEKFVADAPEGWKITVYSQEPREGFVS